VLGIESSCDETAAAVITGGMLRSNVVAGQDVHERWGGVVPELASRAHQEAIVPVVDAALREAGVTPGDVDVVAFTQGPGLMGALLVGTCFARSFAQARAIPLVAVDHLEAHVLAHFIPDGSDRPVPSFPFLNLTVSGGHTLLIRVNGPLDMVVLGSTRDDAAGEAFDKGAKMLGLPYPGGPLIDELAEDGDPTAFELPRPRMPGLDMSFSGMKTSFQDLLRRLEREQAGTVSERRNDLAASLRSAIVEVLVERCREAAAEFPFQGLAISGGVSANRLLRRRIAELGKEIGLPVLVPPLAYCTDNAAMVATAGAFLHAAGRHATLDSVPVPRHH